jgi:hypothetical protein
MPGPKRYEKKPAPRAHVVRSGKRRSIRQIEVDARRVVAFPIERSPPRKISVAPLPWPTRSWSDEELR